MAKKPKSIKKSRFGNPAKAAADATARIDAVSLADVRLERSMEALAPGFALWLESCGRSESSVDMTLMILDDFFDLYRMLEPKTDARALMPDAVSEVVKASAAANPQATFAMRSGIRDYVDYLVQASLWTGGADDLPALRNILTQPAWPVIEPGTDLNLDAVLPDASMVGEGPETDQPDPAEMDSPDVFVPELTAELVTSTMADAPLWKNTLALLDWIGDGRKVTAKGVLGKKERVEAAAELTHGGLGILAGAAKLTSAKKHALARLNVYWELLDLTGLITISATHVHLNEDVVASLDSDEAMVQKMRDLISHFIFMVTLDGSQPGIYEDWHLQMSHLLLQFASAAPPESDFILEAVAAPESMDEELLFLVRNIAHWAEEGLVAVGTHVEVPAAFRLELFEMLRGDFSIQAVGPGAETDLDALLGES
ncbi:hypothetical protein [Arthrobacter sp. E3]|uniref:hypothetical protein n=1 Tax=Arthrobacter sp. E3 TaxID=517402 RepID=UPI001A93D9F8|nr:hypothetical protein [Arthrobacter sp. E3]